MHFFKFIVPIAIALNKALRTCCKYFGMTWYYGLRFNGTYIGQIELVYKISIQEHIRMLLKIMTYESEQK